SHFVRVTVSDGMAVPDTQSFSISVLNINDPPVADAGVDIITLERVTVFLNGTNSYDIDQDSLSFQWSAPEDVDLENALTPEASFQTPEVDEPTVFHFTLVVMDSSVTSDPDTVRVTVNPGENLQITDYSNEPQSPGSPLTISITFPDYFVAAEATLFYLTGGETGYHQLPMQDVSRSQTYSAQIPGDNVNAAGLAHYISAVDTAGQIMNTEVQSVPVMIADKTYTMSMATSAYPEGLAKDKWRIVSLPTLLNDAGTHTILTDYFGTDHGEQTWQIYAWVTQSWVFPDSLRPGTGYWLNQRVTDAAIMSAGAGRSVDMSGMTITLDPGWNLISSPYPFPIDYDLDPLVFSGPYTYGDFQGEGWSLEVDSLKPWAGYDLYNWTEESQTLILNPLDTGESTGRLARTTVGWALNFSLTAGGLSDVNNMIGQATNARDTRDSLDRAEPPQLYNYLNLSIVNSSIDSRVRRYATDIRAYDQNLKIWDVEISSNQVTGRPFIAASQSGILPNGHAVYWIDPVKKSAVDISNQEARIEVSIYKNIPSTYQVISGPGALVRQQVNEILSQLPQQFELTQNFPNPFNGRTTIKYTLETPSQTILKIFNLRGREVKSLVHSLQNFGRYSITWDGTNSNSVPVSSGVYFYQLRAMPLNGDDPVVQTRKMVLLN
ncbi:MAG: FlgD immunoglobulin-like domain containing protein, partial [Fidelibacterota bacterium]